MMIEIQFLADPSTLFEESMTRVAYLPEVPRVGDLVMFDGGPVLDFKVVTVRWCVKQPGPGQFGAVNALSKVVVFLRPNGGK